MSTATVSDLTALTSEIVASYVKANNVSADALPQVISSVYGALDKIANGTQDVAAEQVQPVVPVKKSVKPDSITCLCCGKGQKMLKRHIQTTHNMSVDEYRAMFNLPADYPMVAPMYAAQRSTLAKQIGLGTKRKKNAAE